MSKRPVTRGRPTNRKKKASILDRILAHIPLSHVALRRIATWTIVLVVFGGVYVAGAVTGANAAIGTALAEQVGKAGLRVEQIEVRGVKRMDVTTVYAVALDQKSRAMPLVDLNGVRDRLLQYGWVQDAHVSRRLPDTLLIRIVERTPAAVWQNQGQLSLIDRDGIYLEPVSADAMPDLPLVIGPGADRQEPAFQTLMVAAPALKPRVRAATWVGNRRWDLLFDTGETLSLPEGEDEAAKALKLFAEKDGTTKLLGSGAYIKFDMRDYPNRMVLRPASRVTTTPAPKPSATAKPTTTKSDRAPTRDEV
ncbi:MAG: FtsQ-type POTRA domain-containing protein [Sphingomonas sp.]|uniref:cell division protein FtsQ/DivIB n=1 Tax=Sphingomonas sp. TaxID=28214 RepID=UPI001AD31B95|nr:cell division protein FtsQ/DivIB [Sphingomonas sp.]MBN8814231.1 FtsQ-type POTRA domain-containing protein [Sphingomonas sp.]